MDPRHVIDPREIRAMIVASRAEIRALLGDLEVRTWHPLWLTIGCAAIAAVIAGVPTHTGLTDGGRWAMFIVVFAGGLWVTEAIPAFAVGLLVISLEVAILGRVGGPWATTPEQWKLFIEPWGSPLIWLFFGGFVLARGIARSGLDRSLSRRVLHRFGSRPRSILFGVMAVTFVFSMFASNTATSSMMLAMLAPVVATRGDDPFSKALLLGVAFGANIGGMGTIIGTPPNAIAAGLLAQHEPIGFARWMLVGLPPALVLMVIAWAYLIRRYPSRDAAIDLTILNTDAPAGMPRWRRGVVLVGAVATVGLWLTEPLHGVSPPVVAFVPVALFTASKVLLSTDIRRLEWDVLLLLAGGLSLGVAVTQTGLAEWFVAQLPLGDASIVLLALVLAVATAVLSNFMSNTAAANIVIPMAIALSAGSEARVGVAVALSASASMCLPVSTPPNAIAFAQGGLETSDFVWGGVLIGLIGVVTAVAWTTVVL